MGHLDVYNDPEAVVPADWSAQAIVDRELVRLATTAHVAAMCVQKRRRLGIDATSEELSEDKKRGRRIEHLCRSMFRGWRTEVESTDMVGPKPGSKGWVEIQQTAATIDWDMYLDELYCELTERMRLVVTWCLRNDNKRMANRVVNRYLTELDRVSVILGRKGR